MRLRRRLLAIIVLAGSVVLPPCQATAVFNISLDTSPLIGHPAGPFSLYFQLNDGAAIGDGSNSAILSDFNFGVGEARRVFP